VVEADDRYADGGYLESTGGTWHAEDSPWKAAQVYEMIQRHGLRPGVVGEVGCGTGVMLNELSRKPGLEDTRFEGFDISPVAIGMAEGLEASENVRFHEGDPFVDKPGSFDLLLAMDVLEHVPDYLGFLEQCRQRSELKIYHIPLDISVSAVLRNRLPRVRRSIGHLHYFVADSALDSLRDTGHEIVDYVYTDGMLALFREHPTAKRAVSNVPRWFISRFSTSLAARLLGGYSLLVLAR
jgi:SAM-dependent methyltransferase